MTNKKSVDLVLVIRENVYNHVSSVIKESGRPIAANTLVSNAYLLADHEDLISAALHYGIVGRKHNTQTATVL